MGVTELHVAEDIRRRLGRRGLAAVAQRLWAKDCQSCVRPLAGHTPALVVDELAATARASLHHPECRASQWNDSGIVTVNGGQALSFTAAAVLLAEDHTYRLTGTLTRRSRSLRLPALLVNPSLEDVPLRFDGRRWQHSVPQAFANVGLRPPDQPVDPHSPLPTATARLLGGGLAVQLADSAWSAPLVPAITEAITCEGGLVLMLTCALSPGDPPLTGSVLRGLLRSRDDLAVGWVPLPRPVAASPTTAQRRDSGHPRA